MTREEDATEREESQGWRGEEETLGKRELDGKRGGREPERGGKGRRKRRGRKGSWRELAEMTRSGLFGGEWMLASILDGPPTVPLI
jgi:hypothetical protein